MTRSRDSTPPGGSRPDPYDSDEFEEEEDKEAFVKFIDSRVEWMKSHKALSIVFGLAMLAMFTMIGTGLIHWATGLTTLVFLRLGAHFFRPSARSKTLAFAGKNKWRMGLIIAFALTLPVLAPMLLTTYGGMYFRDWDRTMDPPKIYYVWIVEPSGFSQADQKKLEHLNPGREGNEDIKGLILLAAAAVNLEGDELVPFDRSALDRGERFSLILFESVQEEEMVLVPPKEGEPPPEEPSYKKQVVSHVNVYFITPKLDGQETKPDSPLKKKEENEDGKQALFNMKAYELPPSLNMSFGMLAEGFSKSTGRPISLKHLGVFLEMRKEEQRQNPTIHDGPEIKGPG